MSAIWPRYSPTRLIPADAGNIANGAGPGLRAVHPRGRGEHTKGRPETHRSAVHPRGRGEHAATPVPSAVNWVHPRGRGEHFPSAKSIMNFSVHPRGRGEHQGLGFHGKEHAGSSPRTRGTWQEGPGDGAGRRFIPADAGNMGDRWSDATATPVHPRGRGEHLHRQDHVP